MLEIKNVEVFNLENAVIASRNAMRLTIPEYTEEEFKESLERAKKLVQASKNDEHVKCHDNFLTGILVSFDIVYPQYISPELQRYHFFNIITSSSKMHRLFKMDLEYACNEYVTEKQIIETKQHVDLYNYIKDNKISTYRFEKRDGTTIIATNHNDCLYYAFIIALSNTPLGLQLFMRCNTNYKQLQTIYWQRKNHKLKEDWGAFIKFVEELPYSQELIIGNKN